MVLITMPDFSDIGSSPISEYSVRVMIGPSTLMFGYCINSFECSSCLFVSAWYALTVSGILFGSSIGKSSRCSLFGNAFNSKFSLLTYLAYIESASCTISLSISVAAIRLTCISIPSLFSAGIVFNDSGPRASMASESSVPFSLMNLAGL